MKLSTRHPVGAAVTDLQIEACSPDQIPALRTLLAEHGVMVIPGQAVDDSAFLAFLQLFGELAFATGEIPVDGFPDLNIVSNVGRAEPPRSTFHVDTSYLKRPPAYTALRAVTIPEQGGETLFTNQYRAFDTLPADVVDALRGKSITHVVTGLELGDEDETAADHPVLRRHPLSGRTALYMSTPARCSAITGMGAAEASEMIAYLFEHSTAADNTYRHAWSPGDVVMWDNGCVLHRGDHSGVVGDRVMHRGMVAGYGAAASP